MRRLSNEADLRMEMLSMSTAVMEAMESGKDPFELLCYMLHKDPAELREESDNFPTNEQDLWFFLYQLASREDRNRLQAIKKPITKFSDVISLIDRASRIVVLMGAGASTGPDFRSVGGLYDTIEKEGVLEDPYQVFDSQFFNEDPSVFWSHAYLIFPSEHPVYSAAHYFVESLEKRGKLLRLYTQNVDSLEKGIPDNKLRCVHGSWCKNYCTCCHKEYSIEDVRPAINARTVPRCIMCGSVIRPGIVFYGQPTELNEQEAYEDADQCDLLIVIGTSLQVAPISELPTLMSRVPSILINREPVSCKFNAELLGDCTDVIYTLEHKLGWEKPVDGDEIEPRFLAENRFIFHVRGLPGTHVADTSRNEFLATPCLADDADYE